MYHGFPNPIPPDPKDENTIPAFLTGVSLGQLAGEVMCVMGGLLEQSNPEVVPTKMESLTVTVKSLQEWDLLKRNMK